MKHYLGIDCGSVSLKLAVLDERRNVIWTTYDRTRGDPLAQLAVAIGRMLESSEVSGIAGFERVFATGSGRFIVGEVTGASVINEVTSHGTAAARIYPDARTVIEVGGQDSKLILLEKLPGGETIIADSGMNDICAAGTGSFLDQQAFRMGIDVKELSRLACASRSPAKVSGRCSVFAKTDLIHLQQEGVSKEDLAAGLCHAVVRTYVENLVKGRTLHRPVLFQGGVARNAGVRKAFREILGLGEEELVVPEHHGVMGAIGAVLAGLERGGDGAWVSRAELLSRLAAKAGGGRAAAGLPVLGSGAVVRTETKVQPLAAARLDAFVGVDVGSVSAKIAVIDGEGRVVFTHYATTQGKPLDAVRACFAEFAGRFPSGVTVKGVGATGSGRALVASFLKADVVRNEITAQARAAAVLVPDVDTIIEIGGQDSKYIRMKDGVIVDFVMNKTCAAGTGSFLVEQAGRLDIPLEQFSDRAMRALAPVDMGTRCTVFMETDCIHYQQQGYAKDDILAGLAYSVARNFLEKVVGNRPVDGKVAVQGGIAFNRSVVAAFANVLGRPVTVTPHHEVTGAVGMALIAREEMAGEDASSFVGFGLEDRIAGRTVSQCGGCSNVCSLVQMRYRDGERAVHGGICGQFETGGQRDQERQPLDAFEARQRALLAHDHSTGRRERRIGIPRVLLFHELFPLWATFFNELGYDVVLSRELSRRVHEKGLSKVLVDTCFPIRATFGAIVDVVEQGVDRVFLPYVLDMQDDGYETRHGYNCSYVQQLPDLVQAAMDVELLTHTVRLKAGERRIERAFVELGAELGATESDSRRAYARAAQAQRRFGDECREIGARVLAECEGLEKVLVLVGHSYVIHDRFFNLDLVKRLAKAGIPAIPGDVLPLTEAMERASRLDLKWKTNNRAVNVLEFAMQHNAQPGPRLLPVVLTQFGCAADSMLTPYLKDIVGENPWLELEVDEHNSATGALTRCEAFWDSVAVDREPAQAFPALESMPAGLVTLREVRREDRTIHILPICEAMYAVPEVLARHGVRSEMIPKTTRASNDLGRQHANEKHCRTYQVVLGDLLATTRREGFDSRKAAFFMFDYEEACRLTLFGSLYEKVLKEHGATDIKMFGTVVDDPVGWIDAFGLRLASELWVAIVAADYLSRYRYELRPYERTKGSVDAAYARALAVLNDGIRANETIARLPAAMDLLQAVPRVERDLVRVGLVGDAFTRVHEYGMGEIFSAVEEMGGVVIMPPSWNDFINYGSRRRVDALVERRRIGRAALTLFGSRTLDRLKAKVQAIAVRYSDMLRDPGNAELTELARGYVNVGVAPVIPSMFVGKTVDFVRSKGVHGLVNAYGFNCALGKIATACVTRLRAEHRDLPMFTFVDDGLQQTNVRTRVEAFMEQARSYQRKINSDGFSRVG